MDNIRLIINDDLLNTFDYEGILVHPGEIEGLLVLSNKDDKFTLNIFKIQTKDGIEYYIENKLTKKTYESLIDMEDSLNELSKYKKEDMIGFIQKYG